jgi:hypothetical protein
MHCITFTLSTCMCESSHLQSHIKRCSSQRFGFDPRLINVEFVLDNVAQEQVFLQILQFSLVNVIPPTTHTQFSFILHHILHQCYITLTSGGGSLNNTNNKKTATSPQTVPYLSAGTNLLLPKLHTVLPTGP